MRRQSVAKREMGGRMINMCSVQKIRFKKVFEWKEGSSGWMGGCSGGACSALAYRIKDLSVKREGLRWRHLMSARPLAVSLTCLFSSHALRAPGRAAPLRRSSPSTRAAHVRGARPVKKRERCEACEPNTLTLLFFSGLQIERDLIHQMNPRHNKK